MVLGAIVSRARLVFRSVVGSEGDGYFAFAPWVRELQDTRDRRGRAGVYIVREVKSGRVLYVGMSASPRLYDTLTRHFQRWRLSRDAAKYYTGKLPGVTYDRHAVDVAVMVTSEASAAKWERFFICEFLPRDNVAIPAECRTRAASRRWRQGRASRRASAGLPF